MRAKLAEHLKAIVQGVGAVVAAVAAAALGADTIGEWINVAVLGIGAGQVWLASNYPSFTHTKLYMSLAVAVLVLVTSLLTSGVSTAEIVQLVAAALAAGGVQRVANKPRPPANII